MSNSGGDAQGSGGRFTLFQSEYSVLPSAIGSLGGVAWAFPEADVTCGPGLYALTKLTVGLGLLYSAHNGTVVVTVSLWSCVAAIPSVLIASVDAVIDLSSQGTSPAYYSTALPLAFVANASSGPNASFALTLSPRVDLLWWGARACM